MARIEAHGLVAQPPAGWDAQIYVRPAPDPAPAVSGSPDDPAAVIGPREVTRPVIHLANFPLPADRADFGGGAVELMESGGVFIALLEHEAAAAKTPLFADNGTPWPLADDDFQPENMQRSLPGQAGCQRFFVQNGRPFCLYVVIGSYRTRGLLTKVVNDALASVRIQ